MQFWLLTSEFPPNSGGGISTYCYETVKMLVEHGHQVTVFTQDYFISNESEEFKNNFRIIRFNPNRSYTASFLGYEANLSYAFADIVKRYIQKEGAPNIIEAQEYMGIAYYLLQFKHLEYPYLKGIKVLITLHSPSFLYLEYNQVVYHRLPYYWVGEMEKFCIASADMLISPSNFLVEEIKKRTNIPGTVHIVENPYQIEPINSTITPNKFVFFGKLTPQKGCLKIIEDFKELWADGFNHPLIMIGGGNHLYHPEGNDMIDFIKNKYKKEIQKGLLHFPGGIQPKDLNKYLSDAHIILIPSLVDNLPYAVLEAMGRGKIVLASGNGGQAEVIDDGLDGFLFDHKTNGSFSNQFQKILTLNQAEIINLCNRASQKIKQRFSYKAVYEKKIILLNILKELKPKDNFPFIRPFPHTKLLKPFETIDEPLLSVVIPYYNMSKYVNETVESLKNADYKNIEIILVNDGSNEPETETILNGLEKKYTIKIIHQPNSGLASTRNTGASHAKGSYLAFLDADDTVEPSYYKKAMEVLKRYDNVYFVGCWANYFGAAKGFWPTFNPEPPYLLIHNMINTSALVYKKEAFLNAGMNDREMTFGMEDYESVISLVKNGYSGVALPEPLWNYRIRKNSMARAFTIEKQLYLYRLISCKHSDFFAAYASEVSNLLNANGTGIKLENPTLLYKIPGARLMGLRLFQKLIAKVKAQPRLRKIAIRVKNQLF